MSEGIYLDIDRDRIRTVLGEAYSISKDMLNVEFNESCEDFVKRIEPFLACNRISTIVTLNLPSKKYPAMTLDIDFRRAKIIARNLNKSQRIFINRYLTKL